MIYVNGRFLQQNQTGVTRFAYEICRAWANKGVEFVLCCPPGETKKCYDISKFVIIVCGWGKSHFWEQVALPIWFAKIKGEKILVNFTSLGPVWVRKKVMTIHDLAFMVNPKWYSRPYSIFYRWLTPLCASSSLHILTVSEFSKSEIVRLIPVEANKITVVYNAVASSFYNASFHSKSPEWSKFNEKYILAVSSIDPRKNFPVLLRSLRYVADKEIKLYVIGGNAAIYTESVRNLCKVAGSEKVRWLGRVSDEDLKWYYSHSLCFIYPSLYEGFGIPPLEAMACGTPTIVSAIPAIKEVCGNASLYINPYDEKDIAEKINKLTSDIKLRNDLISRGYVCCSKFGWTKSAELVSNAIENCLSKMKYE